MLSLSVYFTQTFFVFRIIFSAQKNEMFRLSLSIHLLLLCYLQSRFVSRSHFNSFLLILCSDGLVFNLEFLLLKYFPLFVFYSCLRILLGVSIVSTSVLPYFAISVWEFLFKCANIPSLFQRTCKIIIVSLYSIIISI